MKNSALTVGAISMMSRGTSLAGEDAYPTEVDLKKVWECKRVISERDGNNPYSEAELDQIEFNYSNGNPPPPWWQIPPEGPPEGSHYISGPEVVRRGPMPAHFQFSKYRDPEDPDLTSHYDAASNKTWAVYFYDYIEEIFEIEP
jgi:hypothetical protein